jgi:hypothetical protein
MLDILFGFFFDFVFFLPILVKRKNRGLSIFSPSTPTPWFFERTTARVRSREWGKTILTSIGMAKDI